MPTKTVDEFVVPKCTGKAFVVNKGQTFRVIEHEGKQVASLVFFNAHNYKEQCMTAYSSALSGLLLGTNNRYKPGKLFSKVPYENLMLTVSDDKISHHFMGAHCTKKMMAIWKAPGHRSCSDNFSDALSGFGLTLEDIYSPSAFNAFANVRISPKGDGAIRIDPPKAEKGDYIEFLAEMDVLVAVSACPDDITPMNNHSCKAVRVQILENVKGAGKRTRVRKS